MSYLTDAAVVPDGVSPLTPAQRQLVRNLLYDGWRRHVEQLTDLSVQFHTYDERDDARIDVHDRLAEIRRTLVDIEAALHRLNSGSYGRCDGCERRLPFELLEARPQTRWCRRCQPAPDGHGGAS